MFSNDFGGEFNSGKPVNDIFSQAAASANGFPTIGTFSVDTAGSNSYGKERNNMKMKMDSVDGMSFGDGGGSSGGGGQFGQANGFEGGTLNVGTQETGIIEKLLVSEN